MLIVEQNCIKSGRRCQAGTVQKPPDPPSLLEAEDGAGHFPAVSRLFAQEPEGFFRLSSKDLWKMLKRIDKRGKVSYSQFIQC
jgi:hypothetical protein